MAKESNSSVVRVHKNTDFTIMSNHHLRNQKLTLKAVGLMSKILGLPDGWNYSVAGLVKICKEGETAVRAGSSAGSSPYSSHSFRVTKKRRIS